MLLREVPCMNDQINSVFGLDLKIQKSEKPKGLPIYMTADRSFYIASDNDIDFLLINISKNEKFGVIALEKQLMLFKEKTGMQAAYCFESLSRTQRDSLIQHRIPFVSSSEQLYLPFLGMALSNKFKSPKEIKTDKMMPLTQSLFLYMLYNCKEKKVIKKQAADALGVTRTSITRASDQLETMGLIKQEKRGTENYMMTNGSGFELYQNANRYLINPIQKTIMVEKNDTISKEPLSGESALAGMSMLNAPKNECIAIGKSEVKNIKIEAVDERWNTDKEIVRLELWKYDPNLFAHNGIVDPVSLAMTYSENMDERIESAIEMYMEAYKW